MGTNIIKNLIRKYSQKLLDHAHKSATDAIKTASKWAIQKTAEAAGELNGKKLLINYKSLKKFTTESFRKK